ncbi:MAG: nucleotidyltransferase [Clostridiaceae bacterium]|nr:nucleotidyltransferase [Clostridiaceae bacterium]
MKVLGLITEYNPFHNGHLYHLKKSKEVTNSTHTIAIMSGNFLQRGEPALVNKWERGKMAVEAGVDLVVELPTAYACSTAEFFAYGSVSLLNNLGIVDSLCFGSEHGSIPLLNTIADILLLSPKIFQSSLKTFLDQGTPFAIARSRAVVEYLKDSDRDIDLKTIADIMHSPNNILSIEYIKSLKTLKSEIIPYTITRIKADYHSRDITNSISSATAIREALHKGTTLKDLKRVMPLTSYEILHKSLDNGLMPIFKEDFEKALLTILRREDPKEFLNYFDVVEGLENKIYHCSQTTSSIEELYHCIKSKRYTLTRIQRICMHILINLKKQDLLYFNQEGGPQYARVLAFNNKGREILKACKSTSKLPIVTKVSNFTPHNKAAEKMLDQDIKATNIYSTAIKNKHYANKALDFYISPYFKNKPIAPS